ncbi:MAG: metallophosphoesterase family protein [Planctomycetota bacterium]
MIGLFSDVHANLEALEAVLEEMERQGADTFICLGDIVGYGPEPVECVDLIREKCEVALCGNHDFALIYGAVDFNPVAKSSIELHRRMLMPRPGRDDEERRERWEFLKSMPKRHVKGEMLFVHGSPRNPVSEYLRKVDVLLGLEEKFRENFEQVDWLCFSGHTHRAGVITQKLEWLEPEVIGNLYEAQRHRKTIVNVGSVGQPRDRDSRACCATVTEQGVVRFHRVRYDVQKVADKMAAMPGVDPSLADRLRKGK